MPRPMYPIMLDVSDRMIVVIGGGKVAARKVAGLVRAGATHIRLVAPDLRGEFFSNVAPHVEHVAEKYHPANLDGAELVFATTDEPRVNDAVVRDAHERGLFVCRADNDDYAPGDFITPAAFAEGAVHVTVSSGSAALSAIIRDGLQRMWQPRWTKMADFMQTHRSTFVAMERLKSEQRRAVFHTLASDDAFQLLDSAGPEELLSWLHCKHPETKSA